MQSTKFSEKLYRTNDLVSSMNTLQLKKKRHRGEPVKFKKLYKPVAMCGIYLNPDLSKMKKNFMRIGEI